MGPQGQTPAAHDDDEEDHEERRHAAEPGDEVLLEEVGDVVAVEGGHRLADTDDQAAEQRQREGLEAAEERGTEAGHGHDDREGGGGQPGERSGEHGGETAEHPAERPGEGGEAVGRPPERLHRPLVLRAGADGQADPGVARPGPEPDGDHQGDADEVEALLLHRVPTPGEQVVGQVRLDRSVGDAVALRDDRLEETEEADRGDHADDRRRPAQRAEDDHLEEERHRAGGDDRDHDRRQLAPALLVYRSTNAMYAAKVPIAPWAKLTRPEPR